MRRSKAWLIAFASLPFVLLCLCQFSYPMLDFSYYIVGPAILLVPGGALAYWLIRRARNYRRGL